MARAIDSEVAFRFLTEQLVKETGAFSKGVNNGLNIARSAMRNPDAIPAFRPVSREQVILCKDCQYWQGNNGGYPHPECRWGNDETPDEDDYCSFAERLEVSKNG